MHVAWLRKDGKQEALLVALQVALAHDLPMPSLQLLRWGVMDKV